MIPDSQHSLYTPGSKCYHNCISHKVVEKYGGSGRYDERRINKNISGRVFKAAKIDFIRKR